MSRRDPTTHEDFHAIFGEGRGTVAGSKGTKLAEDTVLFVPYASDLGLLAKYEKARAVSLNNLTFDRKAVAGLEASRDVAARVRYLSLWNCKRFDADLLRYFPAVEHLQLTHASAMIASFRGLAHLEQLAGLFLLGCHRVVDCSFLAHARSELAVLSLFGAKRLVHLDGISRFAATLTRLTLRSGAGESPKVPPTPLSLEGIETLAALTQLELVGFRYDEVELGRVTERRAGRVRVVR